MPIVKKIIKLLSDLLVFTVLAVSLASCSIFSGDSTDSPPELNDPVPNANGKYIPESCTDQGDSLEMIGKLELPEVNLGDEIIGYYDEEEGKEYALVSFWEEKNSISQFGIHFIDITNPESPTIINSLKGDGYEVSSLAIWEDYLYVTFFKIGSGLTGIIYDISDVSNPIEVGEFLGAPNLFIAENGYLHISDPVFKIYDLTPTPKKPEQTWNHNLGGVSSVYAMDDRLFLSQTSGTGIFDMSNPNDLEFIRRFENNVLTDHAGGWPSQNGEYFYVMDRSSPGEDIAIFEIGSGEFVNGYSLLDSSNALTSLFTVCDRLIGSLSLNEVLLFDISDPTQLVRMDKFSLNVEGRTGPWNLFPFTQSGNIFAVNKHNQTGLYILQIN